jgi:hypothetical protein
VVSGTARSRADRFRAPGRWRWALRGWVTVAAVSRSGAVGAGEVAAEQGGDPVSAVMRLLVDGDADVFTAQEWRRIFLAVISTRPTPGPGDAPEQVLAAYVEGQLAMRERMMSRAVDRLRDRVRASAAGQLRPDPAGPLPAASVLQVLAPDGTVVDSVDAGEFEAKFATVMRWALTAAVRRETPLMILDPRSMTSYAVTVEGCVRVRWQPAGRGWVLRRLDWATPSDRRPRGVDRAGAPVECSG